MPSSSLPPRVFRASSPTGRLRAPCTRTAWTPRALTRSPRRRRWSASRTRSTMRSRGCTSMHRLTPSPSTGRSGRWASSRCSTWSRRSHRRASRTRLGSGPHRLRQLLRMRPGRGTGDADTEMAASSEAVRLGSGDVLEVPERGRVLELAGRPTFPPDLDRIGAGWQQALDAADRALSAADRSLPRPYLAQRRKELAVERKQTAAMLSRLAHVTGSTEPWLSPVPVTTEMLGLPRGVEACLFDLDGVLTDSTIVHASAWAVVFDDFLQRLNERTGWHFIPFTAKDYRAYMDGRPRLEAIHAFLSSRGIRLPEGTTDDPADADTAHGLARRKGEALARGLRQRGVNALPGSRRFLEAAGRARLKRSVISASAHTFWMLELAGLATLVDDCVEAHAMRAEELRSRPAPDLLLAACARLGVPPESAVTVTHSEAGVAAGHAAGLHVIGVAGGDQAERLESAAERVVPSLNALLDSRFREAVRPSAR